MIRSQKKQLHTFISRHAYLTNSPKAKAILQNWKDSLQFFVKVIPTEYKRMLEKQEIEQSDQVSLTTTYEPVFQQLDSSNRQ